MKRILCLILAMTALWGCAARAEQQLTDVRCAEEQFSTKAPTSAAAVYAENTGFQIFVEKAGLVPYVIVRTNQREVDPLKGNISETAPANPAAGDFWYQIDHTGHTVTLMKYSGSAWAAATETQELTYTWYAQDKDGNPITFDKTGKVIYLSAADIDSILTLQCDVSN